MTMASGGTPAEMKFYLFAQRQDQGSAYILLEVIMRSAESKALVRIKSSDSQAANLMLEVVRDIFLSNVH